METILPATLFVTGALCAAMLATSAVALLLGLRGRQSDRGVWPMVVIEREEIVEANFDARRVIETRAGSDRLSAFKGWLSQHFEDVATLAATSAEEGVSTTVSRDGRFVARKATCGDAVRISISPVDAESSVDAILHSEDMVELQTLRANTGLSPFPLWRTNAAGQVTWLNNAYLEAGQRRHGHEAMRRWPIPQLFDELSDPSALKPGTTRRFSLIGAENGKVSWFDCSVIEIEGDRLFTAMNVDDIVHAEGRLREVTQTLTKTFANLTIGLAVFGRQRNLTLFNPALTELTGLPIDFLASRPGLAVFLDRLREERMMPEPKDYKSWRDQLAQLEAASVDGTFEETWTLPSGQTWRVTGRPHPDGAIAILFEDISIEMSLTRRFHQQLDQSQEVFDSIDDAVVVFGIDGQVSQSNAAYERLWFHGDRSSGETGTVRDATAQWHKLTSPTPIWGDFRDFASETRDRLEWSAEARLLDGRRITCRFSPLSNGATLARFTVESGNVEIAQREMRKAV